MWHSIVVMQLTEVTVYYVVVHCLYVYTDNHNERCTIYSIQWQLLILAVWQ